MSDQKVHWCHGGPALNQSLLVEVGDQDQRQQQLKDMNSLETNCSRKLNS